MYSPLRVRAQHRCAPACPGVQPAPIRFILDLCRAQHAAPQLTRPTSLRFLRESLRPLRLCVIFFFLVSSASGSIHPPQSSFDFRLSTLFAPHCTSTSLNPIPRNNPPTVVFPFCAAIAKIPSCNAASVNCLSASSLTSLSKNGSVDESNPVSRE